MEDFQAQIVERHDISATISVEVAQKSVNTTFKEMMQSLSRQVRVPGFRPGKAPRRVILSQIGGEEVLQQEVRSNLLENFIPQAIQKLELEAIGLDRVNEEDALPEADAPFSFTFTCQLFPEIELPDYRSIVLDTEKTTIEEEEVETFIEGLRERFAIMEPVDGRPVEAGDVVMLGLQSSPESSALPMDLTKVSDMIAEQLIGKEIDEAFDMTLDIPRKEKVVEDDDSATSEEISDANEASDESNDEAAPSLAVFVQDIREKILPERDKEFAETLGQESWEQVEKNIRNNLQAEHDRDTFVAQMDEFTEKLLELSDVTIPSTIIDDARSNVLRRIESDMESEGLTLREYRRSLEATDELEKFEMDVQEAAYKSAKQDLILGALMEKEDITIDNQEFENILERNAQSDGMSLRKFKKELGDNGLANYRYMLRRNKTVETVVRDILGMNDLPSDDNATEDNADDAESNADTNDA